MKVYRAFWITFSVTLCVFCKTLAQENSRNICNRDFDETSAIKTPGDNGFRIKIAGRPPPEKYTPGQVYTVSINGSIGDQKLLGFLLVAVPLNAKDESTQMGTFMHMNSGVTKFAAACPWVVTHTYRHPKAGVEVLWTAPPAGTGCIEFRASVMELPDIWYKNDGALTRVFCEDTGTTENNQPADMLPDCCACGTGKYQMTFHGTWSRRTHPKDYPSSERLLHWSNIVGASHSKNYMIWKYGAYSSKGVKEVCEYGYPRTLEEEMRSHSHDVRTVIKTPGIWYDKQHGLEQTRWARFSVDRRNHLLSMLSMIGPSPDWCAGVSALNLCLPNCTWAGDMSIDLYPWDGGTDDGVSYMSGNLKSVPPQKIHKITNTFPNNPASPFFGTEPIPPLATLKIRRIHPKPGVNPTCTGNEPLDEAEEESEEIDDSEDLDEDMMRKKLEMMRNQGDKCATTEWADWSECSVTCGVGQKFRKRMFLNPMVDEDMCGVRLMQNENCIGVENECESPDAPCAVTGWSDWSPCSVTCGKGIKERRRFYIRKMDMGKCDREMEERDMCVADVMDCSQAQAMKNFSAICSLPKEAGPCRGNFIRWYYDTTMEKCLPFTYGGCRGNNNLFMSHEECYQLCVLKNVPVVANPPDRTNPRNTGRDMDRIKEEMMKKNMNGNADAVDCMITRWSDWSECSATCGKAYRSKTRMIKRQAENGGKECPEKLTRRKRCRDVPKCNKNGRKRKNKGRDDSNGGRNAQHQNDWINPPENAPQGCLVGSWSGWSLCSATCGRAYKYKRRTVYRQPHRDGEPCPKKLERKVRCDIPKCSVNCQLGPWGEWSPCTATCGNNVIQERTRDVIRSARRGGTPCGGRVERRYCSLPPCPASRKLPKEERLKRLRQISSSGGNL